MSNLSYRLSGSRPGSMRADSMYGGAGGHNVRISSTSAPRNFSSAAAGLGSGGFELADAVDISDNKKMAMQNLNDRLASYLEKVRNLETANANLELKIKEFLEKKTKVEGNDYSAYYATIKDLQDKVRAASFSSVNMAKIPKCIMRRIWGGRAAARPAGARLQLDGFPCQTCCTFICGDVFGSSSFSVKRLGEMPLRRDTKERIEL